MLISFSFVFLRQSLDILENIGDIISKWEQYKNVMAGKVPETLI